MTNPAGRPREYFPQELEDEWLCRWHYLKSRPMPNLPDACHEGQVLQTDFGRKLHWYQLQDLTTKLRELNERGFIAGRRSRGPLHET